MASAQIERATFATVGKVIQRPHVGVGQVGNVNVVADSGTVRRRIIGAVNLDVRPLSERRQQ